MRELELIHRFAVQQAQLFVNQKEFPNTTNILDSLYMTKMRQLIDECCKVCEATSIEW